MKQKSFEANELRLNRLARNSCRIAFIGLVIFVFLTIRVPESNAQSGKKSAGAKKPIGKDKKTGANDATAQTIDEIELPRLGFGATAEVEDHSVIDPDENADGQSRLKDVNDRAKEIYFEAEMVRKEQAPLAAQRDTLVGEINQRRSGIAMKEEGIDNLKVQLDQLQFAILTQAQRNAQARNINMAAANLANEISALQKQISDRQPQLDALNIRISPLDERSRKLWNELNACRKQWLEIRVPSEKYARAEYENLKRVIDDWSRVDGLWPEVFCWSAMCAVELGDFEKAWELAEKADKLRIEIYNSQKPWSQIQALKGLIAWNLPRIRPKTEALLRDALSGLDRKTDWETYFIVGRAFAQKPNDGKRAEANFNMALKIRPNCLSAKYQLALLQTTGNQAVLNPEAGAKTLEELWVKTGKRSWRIGFALAKSYKSMQRVDDAETMLEEVLALVETTEHLRLKEEFAKK